MLHTFFIYKKIFENPLFGFNQVQIIAGSLFNIVLNTSVLILIINILIKKKANK